MLEYLNKHLLGAVEGTVVFNNPVGDFLDKNGIDHRNLFKKEQILLKDFDSEKGFVDFLAEIEENAGILTGHITEMTEEMRELSSGISSCTQEVERAKKNGGSGSASFVRKQTRKISGYIETFSKQLKGHNGELGLTWAGLEKSILGLLENDFSRKEDNKAGLVKLLKEISEMRVAVIASNEHIKGAKEASLKNIGLERSLNQSIRFLDEDFATYLSITEQMVVSINRILEKSRFVVGDIQAE